VRTHPVRHRFDVRRPLSGTRVLQRPAHRGQAGEDVVAVHAQARDPEPGGTPRDRILRLHRDRLGDGPVVVLQEEQHGGVVARGEHHRLVHVALARCAVAVVDDDGLVAVDVTRAGASVEGETHRVSGGVQGLRPEHQGVDAGVAVLRVGGVPAAVRGAAHHLEDVDGIDAADPGDGVLAVRREQGVLRAGGARGSDLSRLLPAARRPQGELALALQVGRLRVDRADHDHVSVELLELGVGQRVDERQVALGLGRGGVAAVVGEDANEGCFDRGHPTTLPTPACQVTHT